MKLWIFEKYLADNKLIFLMNFPLNLTKNTGTCIKIDNTFEYTKTEKRNSKPRK